jgi:uncharacterized protein with HEPN domain
MPRSAAAYLADIIEACDAIQAVLADVDVRMYRDSRSTRSSVERELIIIGEAVSALGRVAPDLFSQISHARMVVGFRNVLTHDYAAVDDETVFGVTQDDIPVLRSECVALLEGVAEAD